MEELPEKEWRKSSETYPKYKTRHLLTTYKVIM